MLGTTAGLGPGFRYYDEWPVAAGLLQPGVQPSAEIAEGMKANAQAVKLYLNPTPQSDLDMQPWNITSADSAADFFDSMRTKVCGKGAERRAKRVYLINLRGHFQHMGYLHR